MKPIPHAPFFAPTEFLDLYRHASIPPWPNFENNNGDRPSYHKRFQRPDLSWSFWENSLRHYYGFMSSIDAQIGRLVAYLQHNQLYDDTAIIFSADHGDSQGCHAGIENKSYHMYEETMRIPLVIKPPNRDSTRTDVEALVKTCDIYASILDLAGVRPEIRHAGDGRSLMPFVRNQPTIDWRQSQVAEGLSATSILCTHRMIRKGHWKYVFYAAGTDELYNLQEDPREQNNLIADPAHACQLTDLRQALAAWMEQHNDPIRRDYQHLIRT